ncbi:MAG: DUF4091 domain-containing protein, partial [Clostridia bacterium]|nr:DUF4091 domain-containing protein [Clostridia bacterium]
MTQVRVESALKDFIKIFKIEQVPAKFPVNLTCYDDNYLRTKAGLYPDLLTPVYENTRVTVAGDLNSLFIEVDLDGTVTAGDYPIKISFINEENGEKVQETEVTLTVIDALLPETDFKYTQWFHADCLQSYYCTESFDERHWQIIENFLKTAVRNGINTVLTPVFTPPLDTAVDWERPTTQLVGVEIANGKYTFNFDKLNRWVDMCDRIGVKYFEISHFFTQWGARHAPKIIATVDGEEKRIFGWDTESAGEEYAEFLRAFVPELLSFMKSKNNADKRCLFHISDEPYETHLEYYQKARNIVAPLLDGYTIMDALSEYEFYKRGIIDNPIPANEFIEPFIENNVPNLWTYYCCSQAKEVSNRFISMPSYRNRIIGVQFYKFNIAGFLHWGYNFYYNRHSKELINPYLITDADYFGASGDPFAVYPANDGTAYESLRLVVFYDALQDLRRLKLLESLYGR